ncbi:hypothetical protein J4401_07280 [Candidatus Woesearchaeota archaeon]|nr:hypothetical protein [Candidatus Woesearchaeota archaeon]
MKTKNIVILVIVIVVITVLIYFSLFKEVIPSNLGAGGISRPPSLPD